jgi:hypothetical protein
MGVFKKIAPDLFAEGKRLYELTATPLADIGALMGVSRYTVQRRIPEWGWQPRTALRRRADGSVVVPAPLAIKAAPPTHEERLALATEFHRTAMRGLEVANRILDRSGRGDEAGIESAARSLAATFRALREMTALMPPEFTAPRHEADEPPPRSIDEFRDALADQIERIVRAHRSQSGEGAGGSAGGDDGGDQTE